MPWILRIFMVLSAVFGLLVGFSSLVFLTAAVAGDGPYTVQGAAVSRDEFIAFATPVLLGEAALCALSMAAAWALWRRRYWARSLLIGLSVGAFLFSMLAGTLAGLPMGQVGVATFYGGIATLLLWWILYRRDDVVDWFEALREAE